jgi:hypothetical protein
MIAFIYKKNKPIKSGEEYEDSYSSNTRRVCDELHLVNNLPNRAGRL